MWLHVFKSCFHTKYLPYITKSFYVPKSKNLPNGENLIVSPTCTLLVHHCRLKDKPHCINQPNLKNARVPFSSALRSSSSLLLLQWRCHLSQSVGYWGNLLSLFFSCTVVLFPVKPAPIASCIIRASRPTEPTHNHRTHMELNEKGCLSKIFPRLQWATLKVSIKRQLKREKKEWIEGSLGTAQVTGSFITR